MNHTPPRHPHHFPHHPQLSVCFAIQTAFWRINTSPSARRFSGCFCDSRDIFPSWLTMEEFEYTLDNEQQFWDGEFHHFFQHSQDIIIDPMPIELQNSMTSSPLNANLIN
jgi:hypothetical protein